MNELKLWILRPLKDVFLLEVNPWEPWYDKAFGFIVVAKTSKDARRLASEYMPSEFDHDTGECYDDLINPWLHEKFSSCMELEAGTYLEEQVIMRDFARA